GNNKRKVFRTSTDKRRYCSLLREFKQEENIRIHHYCLMSNHLHLMDSIDQQSNLSRFMKRVNL
ncbi:MAG: transposase, partial [Candidatus Omnitrophota bacterium]